MLAKDVKWDWSVGKWNNGRYLSSFAQDKWLGLGKKKKKKKTVRFAGDEMAF